MSELATSNLRGHEPFGFRDGISQPVIEGLSKKGPAATTLKFGEFVLGYPNEYGRLTDPALLDEAPEVGRNGSYLVFRQLRQDVRGFWRFLDSAARRPDGTPDPEERVRLAAKLVGRWPGGAPLTLSPERDDPALAEDNDFGYHDFDRDGARCPIGAHIRRSNPRDSLDPKPGTAKSLELNRRHRLLRRGREYGQQLTPDEALEDPPPTEQERGLHFMCLNANISRQFEFVQGTWLNSPKFAGLYDDSDPLVGPSEPVRRHVHDPVRPGTRASDGRPAIHLGARWRVLLPAGPLRCALSHGSLVEALVARRLVVLHRVQLLSEP